MAPLSQFDPDTADEVLMTLVRAHDEAAFEILVRRHEERVYTLAVRTVGNADEARDIAQDVFIGIWEYSNSYKPKAKFTTWLYRVVVNRSLNKLRAMRLKSMLSLQKINPLAEPATPVEDTPDEIAVKADESKRVEAAFNALPASQRAALHLKYGEGLPVTQIAQVLKTTPKAVESLLFRGRKALKVRLG